MLKLLLIIFILIIIISVLYYIFINNIDNKSKITFDKWEDPIKIDGKIMWIYWDDLNGIENRPDYISLCLETIKKYSTNFNLIILNKDNIEYYLPELKEIKIQYDLDRLLLAQKVDVYRIMLLYKYGGFYLDTDTILLKNPINLYNLLNEYDFVGYGCTGNICFPESSYGYPSNGVLIARKNSILMKNVFDNILNRLESDTDFTSSDNYFEIGKYPIWEELKKLTQNGYKYYHIKSEIGIRDTSGKWVTAERLFSNEEFYFKDEDKLVMIVLYNNMMKDLKKIKKEEIFNSDWKIKKFF
jgi:hypothetical protein